MEAYETLLPNNSNDAELITNMIGAAVALGQNEKVRDYSEKLLRVRPNAQAGLAGMISAAMARGDFKSAAQQGAQLVKVAGKSFEGWFNLGVAYQKTNRLEQAGQAYAEALKLRPDNALAYANLGATLHERGDLPEARKAYERALQHGPENTTALWNLAIVQERLGNPAESREMHRESWWRWIRSARKPGSASAICACCGATPAGSIEPFRVCVSKRPEWLEALVNLGLAQRRTGDMESAKATFAQAAACHPQSIDALRGLAAVATDLGDYVLALDAEAKLDQLGERIPELNYNIGILLQQSNLQEDAARSYRRATEEKPGFAEALLNLGHALQALGQAGRGSRLLATSGGSQAGTGGEVFLGKNSEFRIRGGGPRPLLRLQPLHAYWILMLALHGLGHSRYQQRAGVRLRASQSMILGIGRSRAALIRPVKRHAHLHAILRDVHARIHQERQHHDDENNTDHYRFVHAPCLSAKKLPMRRNLL